MKAIILTFLVATALTLAIIIYTPSQQSVLLSHLQMVGAKSNLNKTTNSMSHRIERTLVSETMLIAWKRANSHPCDHDIHTSCTAPTAGDR